eukprot:m.225225 g.225225  ORF g.225225 m.225225 type:complete len:420 (-) comp19201_c1_seq1:384-1643(-)
MATSSSTTSGASAAAPSSNSKERHGNARASKRKSVDGQIIFPTSDGLMVLQKFVNDLPPIPPAPKFLKSPFDPSRFYDYRHTQLEKDYKHLMHVGKNVGVDVDLIDPSIYMPNENDTRTVRNPKDDALLIDADKERENLAHQREVSWLRRTTYISSENRGFGVGPTSGAENKVYGMANILEDADEEDGADSREAEISKIERTFEAATHPPTRHPHNPNLTVAEVLPVLPDYDFSGHQFARFIFDADPTNKIEHIRAQDKRDFVSQAVLLNQDLVAELFLPTTDTFTTRKRRRAETSATAVAPCDVGTRYAYTKAREYVMELTQKDDTRDDIFFFARRNNTVYYTPLEARVKVSRRQKGRDQQEQLLSVVHRNPTEDEEEKVEEAKAVYFHKDIHTEYEASSKTPSGTEHTSEGAGAASA